MANINNYINAAAASLNSAKEIERTLADNKIKFADMGAEQVSASAADAAQAISSNAQLQNAKTNAAAIEEGAEIAKSRDESIEQSRGTIRKAGMLAAGANSLAMANYYANKKDQPNDMLSMMGDQIKMLQDRQNTYRNEYNSINSEVYKAPETQATATNQSPAVTGEAPAGSVDRGVVFNYLTGDKGLSRNQALGLMANIDRESSFRIAPSGGDGGNSFGMFQWNNTYGRSDLMKKNVPDYQTNWKGQIDHALSQNQLPEYNKATSDFLNTDWQSPQAAGDAFMRSWEIPADPVAGSKKHSSFIRGYNF